MGWGVLRGRGYSGDGVAEACQGAAFGGTVARCIRPHQLGPRVGRASRGGIDSALLWILRPSQLSGYHIAYSPTLSAAWLSPPVPAVPLCPARLPTFPPNPFTCPQAAQRSLTAATARYAALRGALSLLGPLMWGWLAVDLALKAIGTDYARVVRAVFLMSQVGRRG